MAVYNYDSQSGNLTTVATSGQRTWVGTEAQYKAAQTAGTLPNNAIICVTDDEVDTSHYSTDETFTGMYWIDGKKVYRKVFQTTSPSVTDTNTEIIPDIGVDINQVTGLSGFYKVSNQFEPINWTWANGANTGVLYSGCYVVKMPSNNKWAIRQMVTTGRTNCPVVIILEYTKTTDD